VGQSADKDPDFTDEFCAFLQRCVMNVDAAELLLLIFNHPNRSWKAGELSAQLAAIASSSEADVERYLDFFESQGLVERDAGRLVRSRPATLDNAHIATLARLYLERPVTLFRVIYALRDSKIRTFADAFRLRG
jgi:hypothetical protein